MVARRFRRVARRRVPLRRTRAYRVRRRRVLRRPRAGRGNYRFKFTVLSSITQGLDKTGIYNVSFKPKDFNEFVNLAANFEAYRFTRQRVRVLPQQNVSNNSSSLIGDYVIFPWHRPSPSNYTFNDFLSVDKAKVFRGTGCGSMTFVPAVLVSTAATGVGGANYVKTTYKSRIEIITKDSIDVDHYTGVIGFQALSDAPEGSKAHYNVVTDVWCTMYNQKTIKNY
ncbi:capsid protein [Dragonfly associated cyclovirus 6]|uniref:Capsid protein n=1 Tax=Dragonfly associated cyclovirus 6 TaxID=1574360 RepID=M9V9M6_9CIRC|nr:capsid protein [Dragonfly associated cyclovirus 6]AGJ74755.1 capsid protein [Dragonfly associated cyclovirus 6]